MQRPTTQRSDSLSPFPTSSTSQAMPSPERWSSSPAQIRVLVSALSPSSSSLSKVQSPPSAYITHLTLSHSSLSLSLPRAHIPRPFRYLYVHTHTSFLPRPRSTTLQRRHRTPTPRRATPTRPLPPGPPRHHHIPLPHSSSAILAPINRLWKWARTDTL